MKLVITEKERMALNIAKALGKYSLKRYGRINLYSVNDALILPLKGHIMNYVTRKDLTYWNYSSVDRILSDPYSIVKVMSARGYYSAIRKLAEESDTIIIATDPDEEGENIGLEVLEIVKELKKPVRRLWLTSTQSSDILSAFSKLRDFNRNLALSVEARRKVDSITGFAGTRELTLRMRADKDVYSFGRVQTATLWLIVTREREIESFVPKPYWEIKADVEGNVFSHLDNPFLDKSSAVKVFERIKDEKLFKCSDVQKERELVYPPKPLNTAEMLKAATSLLRISPSRVMSLAEKLYLYGRITYPRVDNQTYANTYNHKATLERLKAGRLGGYASFLLERGLLKPTRGRFSEDHQPITPVAPLSEMNDPMALRLYEIILRHYLSVFGPPAETLNTRVEGYIGQEKFFAEAKELTQRGFYNVFYYQPKEKKFTTEFVRGSSYRVESLSMEEKKTQPPPRFTFQSLLAEMEKQGIGTKSTRPQMIDMLRKRGYVALSNYLIHPTQKGKELIAKIEDRWKDYISPSFTARVEEEMQKIAEGKKDWLELVESERRAFAEALKKLRQT
ncbi:MAG: type IA DNA topoisomerase [Conexivisphaerales archaeon]